MNDKIQTLQADIGFLKALAQDGRAAPLAGGSILVAGGAIFGAASVLQWALQTGRIAASPWAFPILWWAATAVFLAALWTIRARGVRAETAGAANRATHLAWRAAGWTIFTIALCAVVASWRTQSPLPFFLLPSVITALYSLDWSVAAAVSGQRRLWFTAAGAYAMAIVLAALCTAPAVYLLYAATLVLLAIAPGLTLMRQARAAA